MLIVAIFVDGELAPVFLADLDEEMVKELVKEMAKRRTVDSDLILASGRALMWHLPWERKCY